MDREIEKAMRAFMYKHPFRDRSRQHVLLVTVLSIAIFFAPMLLTTTTTTKVTTAGSGPLIVDGHVYDYSLNIVVGASVTVTVWDGSTLRDTQTFTTDSAGFYTVTFAYTVWDLGNTLKVDASKVADSGTASKTITSEFETVDVTFGSVIPEFGAQGLFFAVAGMAGLVLFVAARRRRSAE